MYDLRKFKSTSVGFCHDVRQVLLTPSELIHKFTVQCIPPEISSTVVGNM